MKFNANLASWHTRIGIFSFFLLALSPPARAQSYLFYPPEGVAQKRNASAPNRDRPTVVYVHGGAWVSGSADQYKTLGEALEKRGNCVALIDYRLAASAKHPAPIEDLDQAIGRLRKETPKGCDRKQVFLMGHSAGAHMIAQWATNHDDKQIRGLIGIEGIYDIPNLVKIWPSYRTQFITDEFGEENLWAAASPTRLKLKQKSPWLILHSSDDELVDLNQSKGFEKSLKAQKIPNELVILKTESHFGVIHSLEKKESAASRAVDDFIRKLNHLN